MSNQDKRVHSVKVPRLYKVASSVLRDFQNGKTDKNYQNYQLWAKSYICTVCSLLTYFNTIWSN